MPADRRFLLVVLNVAKQHSVSRGWVVRCIFSALKGWLWFWVLCALQCAKNSVGQHRTSVRVCQLLRCVQIGRRTNTEIAAITMHYQKKFAMPKPTSKHRTFSSFIVKYASIIKLFLLPHVVL